MFGEPGWQKLIEEEELIDLVEVGRRARRAPTAALARGHDPRALGHDRRCGSCPLGTSGPGPRACERNRAGRGASASPQTRDVAKHRELLLRR